MKDGYKFLGWTTTKNGTNYVSDAYGDSYTLSKDATVYAKWEKLYTVKFNLNGGKWTDSSNDAKNGKSGVKNSTVWLPEHSDVTKSGYVFKGWTVKKNSGNPVDFEYKITKDITLYAKWAKAVKVTLNAGKGHFGSNTKTTKMTIQAEKGSTVGDI